MRYVSTIPLLVRHIQVVSEILPVRYDNIEDIANGFSGEPNPAWESLPEDRRRDLARRMAVFAAMVETVDHGVGRIVEHLKSTGDFENTLILFLSDNGACYEWGPFGFDGQSRRGSGTRGRGDRHCEAHNGDSVHAFAF